MKDQADGSGTPLLKGLKEVAKLEVNKEDGVAGEATIPAGEGWCSSSPEREELEATEGGAAKKVEEDMPADSYCESIQFCVCRLARDGSERCLFALDSSISGEVADEGSVRPSSKPVDGVREAGLSPLEEVAEVGPIPRLVEEPATTRGGYGSKFCL